MHLETPKVPLLIRTNIVTTCYVEKILMNALIAYLSSKTPLDVGGVEGKLPLFSSTSRANALKTEYGQDSSTAASLERC